MGWTATQIILFALCLWMFVWLAFFVEPHFSNGRYAWFDDLNVQSDGMLATLVFGAAEIWVGYYLFYSIWRFFVDKPAVILDRAEIHFHRSFNGAPDRIRYVDMQRIVFARADKLPTSAGINFVTSSSVNLGVRLGRKCRSGLRIYYRAGIKDKHVTIYDNMGAGGEKALLGFSATLRQILRSQDIKVKLK